MSPEQEFAAEIAQKYVKSGWKILSPDEAIEKVHFRPDLYLSKNEKKLIVQVRREGFVSSRANDLIKKIVELDGNFVFETKIMPRTWNSEALQPSNDDIKSRLQIAENLKIQGHQSEAFILLWTVIEASLRRLLGHGANVRPSPSSTLVRDAYEEGLIIDDELRPLQAALRLRNHLVHGLQLDNSSMSDIDISDLAQSFVDRAYGADKPCP